MIVSFRCYLIVYRHSFSKKRNKNKIKIFYRCVMLQNDKTSCRVVTKLSASSIYSQANGPDYFEWPTDITYNAKPIFCSIYTCFCFPISIGS